MKKYFNPTLFLVGFCSIETINASISQIPNTTQTNTLDVIKVFADINSTDQTTQIDKFGGKSTISSAQLGMMAPQNGDITSALRIHPNVQFKRDAKIQTMLVKFHRKTLVSMAGFSIKIILVSME